MVESRCGLVHTVPIEVGKIGTGRGRHSVATCTECVAGDDQRVDDHGVGTVGRVLTVSGRASRGHGAGVEARFPLQTMWHKEERSVVLHRYNFYFLSHL